MTLLAGQYGAGTYGSGPYGGGVPRLPQTHVRIAFDRDGQDLGGICTGTNSTLEDLGDWTEGANTTLELNDATSRVYAGHHSARLTAVGAGDISMLIYGLGDSTVIQPGRTYLMWGHVRSETVARQARVVLLWKSGSDIFLTSATSALVVTSTDRWARIGVLATAPIAAERLDIAVDVLDCGAGEVHYVDTVAVDDAGTDVSDDVLAWEAGLCGRNHELDQTTAGSATIRLSNLDGRYSPGRIQGVAPYLGNITPRRRVWILAEWRGVLHPIWSGYTRRWVEMVPTGIPSAAEVTVSCDDGFRWLTAATVLAPYTAALLAAVPTSLYPLTEQSGTEVVTDSSTWSTAESPATARLLVSKFGIAGTAFGADTVLPELATGRNADGGSTALAFHQDTTLPTGAGAVLDARFAPGMGPSIAFGGWCVEFLAWFGSAPPAVTDRVVMQQGVEYAGGNPISGFRLVLHTSTGTLTASTGGSETVATTAASVCDGRGHHVAIRWVPGGTWGTASLVLDGVQVGSLALTADPRPYGSPTLCFFGAAFNTFLNTADFRWQGRMSHLAFWFFGAPSLAELADRYDLGATGLAEEADGDRIAAVLQLADWPAEDTVIDAGLTQLLARDWSETNVLGLCQDIAGFGGGAVVMDARGAVLARSRHRYVNRVEVGGWFTGTEDTDPTPDDWTPWIDDSGVENEVEVEKIGGGTVTVRDRDSIVRYGKIKGDTIPLGAADDDESITHARWRLSRTAEPQTRNDSVSWLPQGIPDLWDLLLPLGFGDRIVLSELPDVAPYDLVSEVYADDYGDYGPEYDALIGRVSHAFTGGEAGTWTVTAQLEPAVIDEIGVCDDDRYGIADDDRCIAGY